jgi:hypothetical protein
MPESFSFMNSITPSNAANEPRAFASQTRGGSIRMFGSRCFMYATRSLPTVWQPARPAHTLASGPLRLLTRRQTSV